MFSWDESANCCPDPWANYTVLQGMTRGQYAIAVGKPGFINMGNLIRLCSGRGGETGTSERQTNPPCR